MPVCKEQISLSELIDLVDIYHNSLFCVHSAVQISKSYLMT